MVGRCADFKIKTRLLLFVTTKVHLKAAQFASPVTDAICSALGACTTKHLSLHVEGRCVCK